MTTAARILDEYALDWQIDQTPIASSRVTESFARAESKVRRCRSTLPAIQTGATENDVRIWLLTVHVPATVSSRLDLEIPRDLGINWTSTCTEAQDRVQRAVQRAVSALPSPGPVGSGAQYGQLHTSRTATDRGVLAGTADEQLPSRRRRALSAVDELAKWLGTTSVQAADLIGYKRSYYNWLKGTQPYPATTLNLFEAHAFIAALVDAIGDRGSREWLQQDDAGRKRLELLRSQEGRDHLRHLSNDLLFPKREEVHWTPDFDFEHDPGDLRVGPESLFGEPLEVAGPPSVDINKK